MRTTANLGLVNKLPAVNSINYKKISNQLISQIHFCRFLYKLTQRIANLQNPGVPKKLTEAIATLIALKLKEIMNLRMLTSKTASLFRKTKEY